MKSKNTESLTSRFDRFKERLDDPEILSEVALRAEVSTDWLVDKLAQSVPEARHTVGMVESELKPDLRMLEVGSGLGLASGFLAAEGYLVTSIEPGGEGFEDYARTNPVLRQVLEIEHPHYTIDVRDITPSQLGRAFDLVFSNNVLEHIPDVEEALERLDAVLAPGGTMVHSCPNYTTPYEPHFGIPLVPVRPGLTERLLPDRIVDTGLWRSLNFVTARQVQATATRLGREVVFRPGILAEALDRLGSDPAFASRHRILARFERQIGYVSSLTRRLPPTLMTPMVFQWSAPAHPE